VTDNAASPARAVAHDSGPSPATGDCVRAPTRELAQRLSGAVAVSGGPSGLPIDVVNAEALAVESLGGNDMLNAGLGLAALTQLTLDGGADNKSSPIALR